MPFQIVRNDIAAMEVDAIVNAANSKLTMGGGVCGAIFKGAGARRMKRACDEIGSCQTGRAVYTPAFDLNAKYVIHAVGPVWEGGNADEEELLISAYTQALRTAASLGAKSIALPLISAGSFGYPIDQAYDIATKTIRTFLERHDIMVYLVVFSDAATEIARAIPDDLQEFINSTYVDESEDQDIRAHQRGRHAHMASLDLDEELSATFSMEDAVEDAGFDAVPSMPLEEALMNLDESFSATLLRLIDERGLSDAAVYKRANISRQLFAKIRKDDEYRPSKPTVLALAIALEMDLADTEELLKRAGFSLSHSSKFDVIVEYFLRIGERDVFAINEALYAYDQPLLGSVSA